MSQDNTTTRSTKLLERYISSYWTILLRLLIVSCLLILVACAKQETSVQSCPTPHIKKIATSADGGVVIGGRHNTVVEVEDLDAALDAASVVVVVDGRHSTVVEKGCESPITQVIKTREILPATPTPLAEYTLTLENPVSVDSQWRLNDVRVMGFEGTFLSKKTQVFPDIGGNWENWDNVVPAEKMKFRCLHFNRSSHTNHHGTYAGCEIVEPYINQESRDR